LTTDISVTYTELYFIPVKTRLPLKFGSERVNGIECLRVRVDVRNQEESGGTGWGEVPLNVQWLWPSELSSDKPSAEKRSEKLREFAGFLARQIIGWNLKGHALNIGFTILTSCLSDAVNVFNADLAEGERIPFSAAAGVFSAFDIAIHDAFGMVNRVPLYKSYCGDFMDRDAASYFSASYFSDPRSGFMNTEGLFPADFFRSQPLRKLKVWHLVGGDDPLTESDISAGMPDDGYPILLRDWIRRDGIDCVKVKLFGKDIQEDFTRLVRVGDISCEEKVSWLSVDFNCTVKEPEYVLELLSRLSKDEPEIYDMLLFIEQPFSASAVGDGLEVQHISALKPLFLDEGLTDWTILGEAKRLGWSGAALKVCKSQTASILSCCAAGSCGMSLMVMDLTNPMLAALSHAALAAHVPTLLGMESNAPQYYPEVSLPEAEVHPGIYRRRKGEIDTGSMKGNGFGYRIDEINRTLPEASFVCGDRMEEKVK